MERAERKKFSQKMSKETTLAINHATKVTVRKSSQKKVCIINFDPNNAPYLNVWQEQQNTAQRMISFI